MFISQLLNIYYTYPEFYNYFNRGFLESILKHNNNVVAVNQDWYIISNYSFVIFIQLNDCKDIDEDIKKHL